MFDDAINDHRSATLSQMCPNGNNSEEFVTANSLPLAEYYNSLQDIGPDLRVDPIGDGRDRGPHSSNP